VSSAFTFHQEQGMRSLKFLTISAIVSASLLQTVFAAEQPKPTFLVTQHTQQSLSPIGALQKLADGNQRFLSGKVRDYQHSMKMRFAAQNGQYPFAFVFNCIDSRSIPEIVFDQSVGSLFVGRIAGNVVDSDAYASMEYAVKFIGSKVIVVMGHTACGAVEAACSNLQTGNLTTLLAKIRPAVTQIEQHSLSKNCKDPDLINAIAKQNVLLQLNNVYQGSDIIRNLVDKKSIELVGAMQDLKTGKVTFFDRSGKEINT
jgi:carbonic anhydrase